LLSVFLRNVARVPTDYAVLYPRRWHYSCSSKGLKTSTNGRKAVSSVPQVVLEVVFKVVPTVLLAVLNMRIMIMYRRSCERRRRMTLCRTSSDEDPRKFAEERRLILLLGSTSVLFLVCVSPMVFLNVTLSETNLSLYSYQVFRAVANLLEVTNYSITFYIYCFFSEDFRNTLLRTFRWPWKGTSPTAFRRAHNAVTGAKCSAPPTTTATSATSNTVATTVCLPTGSINTTQKLLKGLTGCLHLQGYGDGGTANV
jgi:hypothetical protein